MFGQSWHEAHAPEWPHIRCWSDNQTTVSRPNKLSARHPLAQELNRSIGFAEATWRLRVSTGHLPGSWNYVADAGSRLHLPVPVPQHIRRIYTTFSSSFRPHHWPLAQDGSTTGHGDSGARGVDSAVNRASSPAIQTISLSSSCSSPSRAGEESRPPSSIPRRPCCPNVAISLGIIKLSAAPQRREPVTVAHFRKIRAGLNFSPSILALTGPRRGLVFVGATSQSPTSMDAPQTSRASAATSQSPFEGVKQTK
ncbi:hypothetical protein F444_03174 [Phytophthora nicotianae P1976]|uniref:Uncharacterized protein n=1 Tax=Phytophthora nicotianae P1976 TaxID=1317066 RepID=A0A081AV04_PHYNI|nr:hypothetical protein F444_03174 [Phytophthora nicotianae P1976]